MFYLTNIAQTFLTLESFLHIRYYTPKPEYFIQKDGSSFICTVKLPVNAPIYQVVGSSQASPKLAKPMAALEAIKKLHAIGALNDHLLPILDEDEEESMNLKNSSGAGMLESSLLSLLYSYYQLLNPLLKVMLSL